MKLLNNNKGMALIITLILSLISLGLLIALFYMITSTTKISGINLRYATALEAAKGISDYVMDQLDTLDYTSVPASNNNMNLSSFSQINGYNMQAKVLNKTDLGGGTYLYSIRVEASRTGSNEKATIEFIYKVE
jgi:hypothetical protein